MLADAVVGGKRPSQVVTWTGADLTGATLTGTVRNTRTGVTRAIDGVLTVTTPATGVFRWDYGTLDVSEAGKFVVQFSAAFGTSPTPARSIAANWRVHEAITVPAD